MPKAKKEETKILKTEEKPEKGQKTLD